MRLSTLLLLTCTIVFGAAFHAPVEARTLGNTVVGSSLAYAQNPSPKLEVDIDINKGGGHVGHWYANPVWIAIGGVAVLLLLVLIVLAGRGGGTTVVKG